MLSPQQTPVYNSCGKENQVQTSWPSSKHTSRFQKWTFSILLLEDGECPGIPSLSTKDTCSSFNLHNKKVFGVWSLVSSQMYPVRPPLLSLEPTTTESSICVVVITIWGFLRIRPVESPKRPWLTSPLVGHDKQARPVPSTKKEQNTSHHHLMRRVEHENSYEVFEIFK